MDTVTPVLIFASAITRETSMAAARMTSRQNSPQGSVPTLPRNATGVPSRASPIAQIADALPRVRTTSSTTISLPGVGKAWAPWRIRSTLISPTTRTRFIVRRRSGPAVDGEFLHDAADHAVVGRHVGPKTDGEAAEEGEELADEDVQDRSRLVAHRLQAAEVDDQVRGAAQVGGHVVPDDDLRRAQLLAAELADEVHLERADQGIRGEEADDERALVDGGHRAMAQAQVRFRERRH